MPRFSKGNYTLKFLDSYEREDKPFYFGREKATRELLQRVRESRLVVLYGLSGTGKTSLVQCGLANEFMPDDWQDIVVRRGGYSSLLEACRVKFEELIHAKSPDYYIGPVLSELLNVIHLFYFKPIYLIFDQFEELFIKGSGREIQLFGMFLFDLLSKKELPVTVILSIREEYYSRLDQFEGRIPGIFDFKLRLERMSERTVESVITNIASSSGLEISPAEAALIVGKVQNDANRTVELPYLQVYLKRLFDRLDDDATAITANDIEHVGDLEDILGSFLEEQVQEIAPLVPGRGGYDGSEVIWGILKKLITYEGTKQSVPRKQLTDELEQQTHIGIDRADNVLQELEKRQIIRFEEQFVVLKHDSLADKVSSKRTADESNLLEAVTTLRTVKRSKGKLTAKQVVKYRAYIGMIGDVVANSGEADSLKSLYRKNVRMIVRNNWLMGIGSGLIFICLFYILLLGPQREQVDGYKHSAEAAMNNFDYEGAVINYEKVIESPWYLFIPKDSIRQAEKESKVGFARYRQAEKDHQLGEAYIGKNSESGEGEWLDSAYYWLVSASTLKEGRDSLLVSRIREVKNVMKQAVEDLKVSSRNFKNAKNSLGDTNSARCDLIVKNIQDIQKKL